MPGWQCLCFCNVLESEQTVDEGYPASCHDRRNDAEWCDRIAVFVYNVALTKIDASRVAVYIYFEPVVTVLLSIFLLGERLNWPTLAGALAIGVSVAAVNLLKKER